MHGRYIKPATRLCTNLDSGKTTICRQPLTPDVEDDIRNADKKLTAPTRLLASSYDHSTSIPVPPTHTVNLSSYTLLPEEENLIPSVHKLQADTICNSFKRIKRLIKLQDFFRNSTPQDDIPFSRICTYKSTWSMSRGSLTSNQRSHKKTTFLNSKNYGQILLQEWPPQDTHSQTQHHPTTKEGHHASPEQQKYHHKICRQRRSHLYPGQIGLSLRSLSSTQQYQILWTHHLPPQNRDHPTHQLHPLKSLQIRCHNESFCVKNRMYHFVRRHWKRFCVISNHMKYNIISVHVFQSKVLEYIKQKTPELSKVVTGVQDSTIIWKIFFNLCYHKEDYSVEMLNGTSLLHTMEKVHVIVLVGQWRESKSSATIGSSNLDITWSIQLVLIVSIKNIVFFFVDTSEFTHVSKEQEKRFSMSNNSWNMKFSLVCIFIDNGGTSWISIRWCIWYVW